MVREGRGARACLVPVQARIRLRERIRGPCGSRIGRQMVSQGGLPGACDIAVQDRLLLRGRSRGPEDPVGGSQVVPPLRGAGVRDGAEGPRTPVREGPGRGAVLRGSGGMVRQGGRAGGSMGPDLPGRALLPRKGRPQVLREGRRALSGRGRQRQPLLDVQPGIHVRGRVRPRAFQGEGDRALHEGGGAGEQGCGGRPGQALPGPFQGRRATLT